jgi:hypothetical protein
MGIMKRHPGTVVIVAALCLAARTGGSDSTTNAPTATTTPAEAAKCLEVPASFFSDMGARCNVVGSGAIKSAVSVPSRDLYEIAARFSVAQSQSRRRNAKSRAVALRFQ